VNDDHFDENIREIFLLFFAGVRRTTNSGKEMGSLTTRSSLNELEERDRQMSFNVAVNNIGLAFGGYFVINGTSPTEIANIPAPLCIPQLYRLDSKYTHTLGS